MNIHTAVYTNGEIRGQLIPMNEAPVVVCPDPVTLECGSTNTATAVFTDPEGDALAVLWTLNGVAVQTNMLPARAPGLSATASLTETWPVGTSVVGVVANDIAGNTVSCSTLITVVDTNPPVVVSARAEPNELWPPNHKLVNVVVIARVTDTCAATTWKILSVRSNQSFGSGKQDWVITGDHTLQLRAERYAKPRRIYSITLKAMDAAGNVSATKVVTVTVPHSQGNGKGF